MLCCHSLLNVSTLNLKAHLDILVDALGLCCADNLGVYLPVCGLTICKVDMVAVYHILGVGHKTVKVYDALASV